MFTLKYMGSVLKIEQPSEISITPDGVKVIIYPSQDPKNASFASAAKEVEKALEDVLPSTKGSVKRNVQTSVRNFLADGKKIDRGTICSTIKEKFPEVKQTTFETYLDKCEGISRDRGIWSIKSKE